MPICENPECTRPIPDSGGGRPKRTCGDQVCQAWLTRTRQNEYARKRRKKGKPIPFEKKDPFVGMSTMNQDIETWDSPLMDPLSNFDVFVGF